MLITLPRMGMLGGLRKKHASPGYEYLPQTATRFPADLRVQAMHFDSHLKRGLSVEVHPRYRIGLVDTDGDLAEWGNLRLAFMEHRGRPIAFELGWTAKGG